MGIPLFFLMRWFYTALAGRVPRVARRQREGHRQVRRDDDRHPRGQGVPQGGAQRRRVRRALERLPRRSTCGRSGSSERSSPGSWPSPSVTVALVLLWGGIRVVDGTLALGVLTAAVLYVRNFFAPLQEVAFFLNSYQSATAALEKVSGVLEEEPTVPDPAKPVDLWQARGHIHFDDVALRLRERPRRSCPTSRSTSRPVRRSRWWARRARASRRSRSSCRGSTTRRGAR